MKASLTKIVCTIGPSSSSKEKIKDLIDAGMSVARLNFSHGSREEHLEVIRNIKDAICSLGRYVSIALDTRGPEIRIRTPGDKNIEVNGGDILRFSSVSSGKSIWIPWIDFRSLGMGDRISVDDGRIDLKVVDVEEDGFGCEVLSSGIIRSNKSMNFPNIDVGIKFLSDEDRSDIVFGLENGIDMIFASFVNSKKDVEEIRKVVGNRIPVVSKIESCLGMKNLEEIVLCSDGVMIARGDLGAEVGLVDTFSAQKKILLETKRGKKPAICATQMMESMTSRDTPSRAEISDVGNAVLEGCDCVMLSGESAVGMFPIETVKFMRNICIKAETYYQETKKDLGFHKMFPYVKGIVVCTDSMEDVERLYLGRPGVPIILISEDKWILRRFSIWRGVFPMDIKPPTDVDDVLRGLGLKGTFLVACKEEMKTINV
ncbi:pyruvate kinase [Encephalitozoon intestinalis ATCC 50506]|uniref:Pyruvate kinase n=1 Tax=Encephalitozoon intestinalis (strain ATCC 50506) TaxID=876142 RepID=E0S9C5_ENCIT|nr:pyruvate kinase [Encephalitozoon intestinalis ATCC 50506]ADM12189.2 pyruvate kinase [Encephalitozoon intestinalis ATCC 50506]UTX45996.1 pyruvate kinase [Encephalitozoon intestinalis]